MQKKPVVLIILDGFGHSEDHQYNAISIANTPNWDNLKLNYPHGLINASEEHVGLPNGQKMRSNVTTSLDHPQLSTTATTAHVFTDIQNH